MIVKKALAATVIVLGAALLFVGYRYIEAVDRMRVQDDEIDKQQEQITHLELYMDKCYDEKQRMEQ
jgi:hypothetical protein